jgi:preprotein translocase subunit SecD
MAMNPERPSDDEILAGLERHLAGVDDLLPNPPAWRAPAVEPARFSVRGRHALGAFVPVVLAAVVIAALGLGLNERSSGCDAACQQGPSMTIDYRLAPPAGAQVTAADLDATAAVLATRAGSIRQDMGLFVEITKQPPDRISVMIRGGSDHDLGRAAATLDRTGDLGFVLLPRETYGYFDLDAGRSVAGTRAVPAPGSSIDPALPAQFGSGDLDRTATRAAYQASTGWQVEFTFQPDAAASFATWSREHVGDFFAVVMDGNVIEAPYIKSPVTGGKSVIGAGIGGGLSEEEARDIATVLRSGPLPVSLQLFSYTINPTPSAG